MGWKFGRDLFYCCEVGFYGGIWGLWQSLGLFGEGILFWHERDFGQVGDPLVGVITGFTCIPGTEVWVPSVVVGAVGAGSVPEEDVGTMHVAGTAGLLLA